MRIMVELSRDLESLRISNSVILGALKFIGDERLTLSIDAHHL